MSRPLLRAVALAAALLPATRALAAPLSLDQAIDLAVQRSQMTLAARAGALGAAESARAAGQQPDPMLDVGIDNLPATGANRFRTSAEDMTMKRIGLSQEWVSREKRTAREAVAGAVVRRETVVQFVAAADARVLTAIAYIEAYFTGEELKITALNEKHAREELEAGKGRLATASGSSADVLGLTGALGMAEDESADVLQQEAAAKASLQRWTGTASDDLVAPHPGAAPVQGQGGKGSQGHQEVREAGGEESCSACQEDAQRGSRASGCEEEAYGQEDCGQEVGDVEARCSCTI